MDTLSIQGLVALLAPAVLEALKRAAWFRWLTPVSDRAVRVWSALIAVASSVGVTVQSDWTAGSHAIEGLTVWALAELVGRAAAQFAGQEVFYRRVLKPWLGRA